jgi:hypothetical protein
MADDDKTSKKSVSSIQEGITMAVNSTIEKTREDVKKALSDPTPLYVLAGVGDLAVEKVRAARNDLAAKAAAFDAKALADSAQAKGVEWQAKAAELPTRIAARVSTLQDDVKAAPEQAKDLPAKAQAKASDVTTDFVTAALTAYGQLAGRGKVVVDKVRKQPETVELKEQAKSTVSKAKATKTTAKKAAKTTKKAVRSTTTSAKKSAAAAADAAEAAAEKIGD